MKKFVILGVLLLFLQISFGVNYSFCQWQQMSSGINGGTIISFAASGSNLYTGTYGEDGVYYSTNSGAAWTKSDFPNGVGPYVYSLAVLGNYVIAGTNNGICVSTNSGINFTGRSLYLTYIYGLAVSGSNIFAAAKDSGVYISSNNGANWSRTALNNVSVIAVTVSGSTIYAGSQLGVYYSTNNGTNWTLTSLTSSIYSLAASGNNVYAGTANGLYFSTNGGTSWTLSGINSGYVRSIKFMGTTILAQRDNLGVWASSNSGINWSGIGLSNLIVQTIEVLGTTIFAGTFYKGVYSSTNNGANWIQTELHDVAGSSFLKVGSTLYCGTYPANVYSTTNSGLNWTPSPSTVISGMGAGQPYNIFSLAYDGSSLYAACDGGMFKSTDNSQTWTELTGFTASGQARSVIVHGNNIFASVYSTGADKGIYKSSNGGLNWTQVFSFAAVFSLTSTGNKIFAGSAFNGVYVSSDSGATWNQSLVLNDYFIYAIASSGNNVFAGLGNNGGIVYRSTDGGANWNQVVLHTGDLKISSLCIIGNIVFAGTNSSWNNTFKGVYVSTNLGANWALINTGIPTTDQDVYSVYVADNYIYAGMRRSGVFRRPLSEIITGSEGTALFIPPSYKLHQNFPNPFNPVTKIKYEIPEEGFIKLTVYNSIGMEVETLFSGRLSAGVYEKDFNASGYSSGIYYYTLSKDGKVRATNKMVLLK